MATMNDIGAVTSGLFGDRGAALSADGVYRYRLWRTFDSARPPIAWIMLNPSTATAEIDDPTIRRCVGFSRAWGSGGIIVVNLFAFRATDPKQLLMRTREGAVGPENDSHIAAAVGDASLVIAAWGAHGTLHGRDAEVIARLRGKCELRSLGVTQAGHPKHPLYIPSTTAHVPFGGLQ